MTLPNRRIFFLLPLALIAVVLVISSMNDSRTRIAAAERMMVSQGRAIVDIIAESSLHGIGAYNKWEKEVSRRLINNAQWVAFYDSLHGLTQEGLAILAEEMGLNRILVFGAGAIQFCPGPFRPYQFSGLVRVTLEPLGFPPLRGRRYI